MYKSGKQTGKVQKYTKEHQPKVPTKQPQNKAKSKKLLGTYSTTDPATGSTQATTKLPNT
jgi:hypothetical protein